jgi:hypothetical protein
MALIGDYFPRKQSRNDLECVFQSIETPGSCRKIDPKLEVLTFEPRRAECNIKTTTTGVVDGNCLRGKH